MNVNKCFYCECVFGSPVTNTNTPLRKTKDHIIPRGREGNNIELNLVDSCHQCNHLKGSRLPEEFTQLLEWRIIAAAKGISRVNCFSGKRLQTILSNNKRLIETIVPYRDQLFKKYRSDGTEIKSIKQIANVLREKGLKKIQIKKREKKLKEGCGFFENPLSLNLYIQQCLLEPEPNFHY